MNCCVCCTNCYAFIFVCIMETHRPTSMCCDYDFLLNAYLLCVCLSVGIS